jgi:hypothetical protein
VNPVDAFEIGIAPEHILALLALLLLPFVVLVARRLGTPMPVGLGVRAGPDKVRAPLTTVERWVAWLLAACAAVHAALPFGQHDRPVLVVGFLGAGAAFAWVAMRVVEGRSWRLWSALLFTVALIAYAAVSVTGAEQPDQVGLVTVMAELAGLGVCLVPLRERGRRRLFARFAGSAGTVASTFLVGALIWAGTLVAHSASPGAASASASEFDPDHVHGHAQASRAQAGIVVRLPSGEDATAVQQQAAAALAAEVRRDTVRFANLDAALAAGYTLPLVHEGTAVHLENKAYQSDGRVLDPQRPETLVYAISGGRATLLGALFVMPTAGQPGPAPGGPITHWHAHNVCVGLLPPGFGLVTPFGSCSALTVNITTPEMMHVWVVNSPGGPYADGLDDTWVRAYHAMHGVPYTPR